LETYFLETAMEKYEDFQSLPKISLMVLPSVFFAEKKSESRKLERGKMSHAFLGLSNPLDLHEGRLEH
jgi:hypothetical protein